MTPLNRHNLHHGIHLPQAHDTRHDKARGLLSRIVQPRVEL